MADQLSINRAYAEEYEKRKRAQELSKLKEKYGSESSETESSSEEEDDDAEALTDQKRRDFLRTLSLVKSHDPCIYEKEVELFREESSDDISVQENKESIHSKPLYLRDYEREQLLTGQEEAEEEEGSDQPIIRRDKSSLLYNEEQKQLKADLLVAMEDNTDTDNLLTVRVKTQSEKEDEEKQYSKWLENLSGLQSYWSDPQLDPGEAFLRDYILDEMWIDRDRNRIPTYDEVTEEDQSVVSDDEEIVEEQEVFEKKYNFRFEEPGGASIVSYPRNIADSVRAKDTRRIDKRKSRNERKLLEKQQKQEELKRLKNLKKQEIVAKLEKLKKLTNNPSVGFSEDDLVSEFDPAAHDKAMSNVFNEEYYGEEEESGEKPVFSESEEEEDWDNWIPPNDQSFTDGPHCEDPDFNMDADYNPEEDTQMGVSKRKRRRVTAFSQALKRQKPLYEPQEDKSFSDYFDEYYRLDYEDLIGDLPCRFHYRSVVPNDFGLSTEEILTCEDRELNRWVSLKKAVQYRTKEEEKRDVRKYRRKAADSGKKRQVLISLYELEREREGLTDYLCIVQRKVVLIERVQQLHRQLQVVKRRKRRRNPNAINH